MFRSLIAVAVAAVAGFAVAEDKKDEKPALKGTWTREHNGATIDLKFAKPGELALVVGLGDNTITVNCEYTLEKDGLVKVKVKGTEVKGMFPDDAKPKDGLALSFKFKVDGKKATLSDFEAKDLAGKEGAKDALEGEYETKAK